MNLIPKITSVYNTLHTDYVRFIGPEAIGFFFTLIALSNSKNLNDMTVDYIVTHSYMEKEKVQKYLLILKTAKLISNRKLINEWEVVVKSPKFLGREDKMDLVYALSNKNIIEDKEKMSMIEYINNQYDGDYHKGEIPSDTKTIDFENGKPRAFNPDTGLALVGYYYDFLSETFGAKYQSRTDLVEARNLKEVMKKNGDTAEMTREFFRWIITRAKQRGQFDQVSSMGLYPEWRKQAHYAIVVKGQAGAKFAPEVSIEAVQSDESIQENIQKVFVMYKDRGMDVEEIDTKLRSNFSEQAVDKFFEKVTSGN